MIAQHRTGETTVMDPPTGEGTAPAGGMDTDDGTAADMETTGDAGSTTDSGRATDTSSTGTTGDAETVDAEDVVAALAKPRRPPVRRAERGGISKPVVNFWLDILLAGIFVALCSTAAVLQFVFPAASLAGGWTLWGLTYDDVAAVQFGILCVLAAGIVLHVMLHWSWVCGMLTRGKPNASLRTDDGIRTIVGVGVLIAVLHVIGGVLLAALLSVQQP